MPVGQQCPLVVPVGAQCPLGKGQVSDAGNMDIDECDTEQVSSIVNSIKKWYFWCQGDG